MAPTGKSNLSRRSEQLYPSKFLVVEFSKKLAAYLFPVVEGGAYIPYSKRKIKKTLVKILSPIKDRLSEKPDKIAEKFFNSLPDIKIKLEKDAAFIAINDPAASETNEVIMTYPGFYAILIYRIAHYLSLLGVSLIPRIMTEYAHSLTGIDIHPKASIGEEFCIDHGTGIVIGETAIIGNRVKFYQGVTIGALSVSKEMASTKRHPTIEDDVIIYAGSTILGGETVIGHDSVIGGNVWLTDSVPSFSLVYHQSQTTIKDRGKKSNIYNNNYEI